MAKEEIVEGLRLAVSKGESIEKAMMSFYNAGYLKEEIEEAARALSAPSLSQPIQQVQPLAVQYQKPQPKPLPLKTQAPRVVQRVSAYEKPNIMGTTVTIVLFALLLLLLGILAAVILFKDELANLFNNFFWRALF